MQKGIVFIASLGARDKRTHIFNEIVSLCPGNDYSPVLYITPATFSQTGAKKQFFSFLKTTHKKSAYIPFQSFTLTNFCTHLYETYHFPLTRPKEEGVNGRIIISDRIEPFILCEIIGEKNIGYASLLSDLMSKILHYIPDKDLSHIKTEIKSLIFEEKTMKRAVKALEILEAYEKELHGKGLITLEGIVKNSIALIKEHISPSILVLDGFFDPTKLELEIIKALLEKSQKVFVLVEEDADCLKFFESQGHIYEKKMLKPSYRRDGAGYSEYPSMEEEVEGIAKSVKALIIEGTSPREIVVSFPVLTKYLPMLGRIFQKYGIPFSVAEYDISDSKPFAAIEDMISSIENDYPRTEFLSFLTSPFFPEISEVLRKWSVSFSIRAGIVKGRQAWLSIKETLFNSTEEEISPDTKETIEAFQQEMKKVINTLEKLKQEKNLVAFIHKLEEVLSKFGFFDFIEGTELTRYGDNISQAVNKLLSELRHFSEIYNSDGNENSLTLSSHPPLTTKGQGWVKGGTGGFGIEVGGFYLRHLFKGLKGRIENVNGVVVVPFEFAAGLETEALFLGGMVEREFPSKPNIDPIMPEKVKETLGLPFLEYYLDRQERYFKRLLHVSSGEPNCSYPSADGDKIFLPSPLLDWGKSLNPLALNISTEEEILVSRGAMKQKDFSEALLDGELPVDTEVPGFLKKRLGAKIFFSVTDVDAYRQCPFRFYIERVLCLEIERPPKFEVEAKLWGMLAHRTMEHLYKDGVIDMENMEKRIIEGLETSLKQFPVGDFWAKVAREIFQRLLPFLKEQEMRLRTDGFAPYQVEQTIKTTVNGMNLKGKIDRIDKKSQISNLKSQNGDVILLDYKTGSIDRDSLQLPLYAAMWQEDSLASVEKVGFYSLRDGMIDWYPKRLSMEEFIQEAVQTADELIQNMKKGIFTPAPFKDEDCRYCYHSALCKGAK